jgi:hypothetical protein
MKLTSQETNVHDLIGNTQDWGLHGKVESIILKWALTGLLSWLRIDEEGQMTGCCEVLAVVMEVPRNHRDL